MGRPLTELSRPLVVCCLWPVRRRRQQHGLYSVVLLLNDDLERMWGVGGKPQYICVRTVGVTAGIRTGHIPNRIPPHPVLSTAQYPFSTERAVDMVESTG
jgi:hypothetical protein